MMHAIEAELSACVRELVFLQAEKMDTKTVVPLRGAERMDCVQQCQRDYSGGEYAFTINESTGIRDTKVEIDAGLLFQKRSGGGELEILPLSVNYINLVRIFTSDDNFQIMLNFKTDGCVLVEFDRAELVVTNASLRSEPVSLRKAELVEMLGRAFNPQNGRATYATDQFVYKISLSPAACDMELRWLTTSSVDWNILIVRFHFT
jgi:hypothetical protein